MVQPRLSYPAANRLAVPRVAAAEVNRIRSSASDPGMARPAPPTGSGPALLRVLPFRPGGGAADLYRSSPDAGNERRGAALARSRLAGERPPIGRQRDLLLHHQLPGRAARRAIRQPIDKTGGGRPQEELAANTHLRYFVADPRLSKVAGRRLPRPGLRQSGHAHATASGSAVRPLSGERKARERAPGSGGAFSFEEWRAAR